MKFTCHSASIAMLLVSMVGVSAAASQNDYRVSGFAVSTSEGAVPSESDGLPAASRAGGTDADSDGFEDYADNCELVANASQLDTDSDGFGNACDMDLNNDLAVNFADYAMLTQAFLGTPGAPNWNPNADFNGDNVVNFADVAVFPANFLSVPGPSGMSCAGASPCPAPELTFAWPMPGDDADEWVINNYVDLNPGAGVTDFTGGAKSYNGHRGIDIDVPTFRAMDSGFPIYAVAQGVVLAFDDVHFDRNTSCSGSWNFVTVGHPNGFKTIYGHLKQNSVVVAVGDIVNAGDTLGVVGSSGCSTAPHLHLETLDPNNNVVEPFADGMWQSPPVYDTLLGFMDATLYAAPITGFDMVKDPPPNATSVSAGSVFGFGLSMGGGDVGDTVNMRIVKGGSQVAAIDIDWPDALRHSYWWWNYPFASTATGAHVAEVRVNGSLVASYPVEVTESVLSGFTQVRHGVPEADYQALFDQFVANGYRPVWVDGYQVGSNTFFNMIFDQSPVASWASAHHLDASQYQTYFNQQTQAGRRLVHIDSYRLGNTIRYAPIFVQQGGSLWAAYHNATTAQHQANFDSLVAQGYRASHISLAQDSAGTLRVTALYDQNVVGGWVALANLTDAQYQDAFNEQAGAGRALSYLNAYSVNGTPRFSAIFNTLIPNSWVAQHNLTNAGFQASFDTWTGQGLNTRLITGYDNGSGTANFAGLWSN